MALVDYRVDENALTILLNGKIDSANSNNVETEIRTILSANPAEAIVLDATDLLYISSAGLRVILRLRKDVPDTKIINVSSEVYDIFDMTGFTEILEVQKAYRVISVDGCEVIGQGANGKVYRIDPDTIVKVYFNPDALPEIHRERELARTAFVSGIPTAIPYDVVRVGKSYGSVFELLNAESYAKLLINGKKTIKEVAEMSVELLKQIHATLVDPDIMPDMKQVALDWVRFLKDYLPADQYDKLYNLVEAVPDDMHMMHGDYHIKNVMLQNGESLLIDMDTLCTGHPIFELASMYNAYCGFSDIDHDNVKEFLGISYEDSTALWHECLKLYLDTDDEARISEVEKKAMLIGYTRILRRTIRRNGLNEPEGQAIIANCKKHIETILKDIDTLVF